jgi:transposase InsO family protein
MPWQEVTRMSLRLEFVTMARKERSNLAEICRRFGISRKIGYKWLERYGLEGITGLQDRSRRPQTSPSRTPDPMEEAVLEVREKHATWGGRKIKARLQTLGWQDVPAASTITEILRRHGCIDPEESGKHKAWNRFEAEAPNVLWQMDFKGHFEAAEGRCHPLTVLDDHSRYSLGLQACADEKGDTVHGHLVSIFRRYGLPQRILVDNGSPWGSDGDHPFTLLTVWLMRQGIRVSHSRPYHPQTLGKDERFHRTLWAEVSQYCVGLNLEACQGRFEGWREMYNFERPHEALEMAVPASRYQPSSRSFQESLPPTEYGPGDQVRKVQQRGKISYGNREYALPKAFCGHSVALRPTPQDGVMDVFFCDQKIMHLDLKNHTSKSVTHVPEHL